MSIYCFYFVLVAFATFISLGYTEQENSNVEDGKNLLDFLEHLAHFYVPDGVLAVKTLQEQMKDLNKGNEIVRSTEKLVKKISKTVDMIVKESEEKRKEEVSKVVKFFQSRFVKVVQEDIKESEKTLKEYFKKMDPYKTRLNGYVSEGAKQKKMLTELLDYATKANFPIKSDDKMDKQNSKELERNYHAAAVQVFLQYTKAILTPEYDLTKGFETLKNDLKTHEDTVRLIADLSLKFTAEFQSLESKEAKLEWILNQTRQVFHGRLINNIQSSLTETNRINAEAQKKMSTGLSGMKKQYKTAMTKLKVEETLLGEVVISSFKLEL